MEMKYSLKTSWPISIFWVFLSLALALLSTYSFLQADWVIKRSLVITDHYEPLNETSKAVFEPKWHHQPFFLLGKQQFQQPTPSPNRRADHVDENGKRDERRVNRMRAVDRAKHHNQHIRRKVIKVSKVITSVRFGTIGVCTTINALIQCQLYEHKNRHSVSSLWATVTMIGGCGCITLCVSAVFSLMAVALPSSLLRFKVATVIGHIQTAAVVLLFLSLLLYPLGFDSDFVRYHCGPLAAPYNIADCEIGWAYALILVCASLALYCPILVKFTADIHYNTVPKYL